MWDPSPKLFLLILLNLYCSRPFHRRSTWIRGEICFIERFHSRGWASAQMFLFVEQKKAFTQGYFQRSCLVDEIRHIHNALIITFQRRHRVCYYGFAPCLSLSPPLGTSFGWFVFLSSHLIPPNFISGVYLSSRRGRQFFPTLYMRVGRIGVNGLLCSHYTG